MTDPNNAATPAEHALDAALAHALRAPELPQGFRNRLQSTLAGGIEGNLPALRQRLERERQQQLDQLEADYVRVRRGTLGTLIGVAFAAGVAVTVALPWLQAHLGTDTPMAITWAGVALGLGMVFFDPVRSWLRRWSDIG